MSTPEQRERHQKYVDEVKAKYYSDDDKYRGVKVSVWLTQDNICVPRGGNYYIQRESDGCILDLLPVENRIGWHAEVGFGWRPLAEVQGKLGVMGEMISSHSKWRNKDEVGIK